MLVACETEGARGCAAVLSVLVPSARSENPYRKKMTDTRRGIILTAAIAAGPFVLINKTTFSIRPPYEELTITER